LTSRDNYPSDLREGDPQMWVALENWRRKEGRKEGKDEEPLRPKELKELFELTTQWTQLSDYADQVTFQPAFHLEREPVISRFGGSCLPRSQAGRTE
jgi:hypothetical protein